MKKLQKTSLNELAQKMPVVSEKESAECVGGDFYFDRSGNYMGATLSGNNIYFSNQTDFNNYAQSNPNYLASISFQPSHNNYYGNVSGLKKIAEYFLPSLGASGQFLIHTGVAIGNSGTNHDLRSAYNGKDMFINCAQNLRSFNDTDRLNFAYYYAKVESYHPGQEFRF